MWPSICYKRQQMRLSQYIVVVAAVQLYFIGHNVTVTVREKRSWQRVCRDNWLPGRVEGRRWSSAKSEEKCLHLDVYE